MNEKEKLVIEKIRKGYMNKKEDKLEELKSLNAKVTRPVTVFAYVFGSIGSLVLGTGMCMAMGKLAVGLSFAMPLGIAVGLLGIVAVSVNYFIYKGALEKRREKHADQALSLISELLEEEND